MRIIVYRFVRSDSMSERWDGGAFALVRSSGGIAMDSNA